MVFLAKNVASVFSVEHDAVWFAKIHSDLQHYPAVTHFLVSPERKSGSDAYKSINGLFTEGVDFENYAHAADHLKNNSIDLLILDGRVRPQGLIQAKSKLKPGGILLFDNSDRVSCQPIVQSELKGWREERFLGVTVHESFFNHSSLFFKPFARS